MIFKPIQPVVITPFKKEDLVISDHLFRFLRRESDYRGLSASETARQLILTHLDLKDENQLIHALKSRIDNRLRNRLRGIDDFEISLDNELITVLANALTVIELKKISRKIKR